MSPPVPPRDREVVRPQAPSRDIFDVFPGVAEIEVDLGPSIYTVNTLDPFEKYALAAICQLRRPRRIFEIGTFNGESTRILARSAPGAEVFTLDLPPERETVATVEAERDNVRRHGVGSRFAGLAEAQRITQLLGDSRSFDFSPWHASVDLILVDAGHEWDAVAADTRTAEALLAPGGVIIWDDYMTTWPDVIRAVDGSGLSTFHLARSDFAIHDARAAPEGATAQ